MTNIDIGRVLAVADETKRALRQRVTAALGAATGKEEAAQAAQAAVTVLRELDPETVRRAALAFLVGLAADDARFRAGVTVGRAPRKLKSDAPAGGRQNLRAPMPKGTRYTGETFTADNHQARYAEWVARRDAEQAKKEAADA